MHVWFGLMEPLFRPACPVAASSRKSIRINPKKIL
jgi:hypothetical protein